MSENGGGAKTTNRDEVLSSYLAAFRAANPGRPEPQLKWTNGWFVDLNSHGPGYGRYRTETIITMRETLLHRVEVEIQNQ